MATVEQGSHTISLLVMGCSVDGSLRDFYVDPVVPTDRCVAEGGYCSAGVGRRIGDCRLASFDCPLVRNGGLLFVRRSFPSQPQGFVVPPLLRDGELRISGLLLQGLQETSATGECARFTLRGRPDHAVSKTVSSERYNRQTCVQVHVSRHLRLRDAALLSVVTVNR